MARHKFADLVAETMSPEARARAQARTARLVDEMPLQELRRALKMSQATIAQALGANQPQISKIEHSTDLYLSTLRRYVEALGGTLDVVATFDDGSVRISQFSEIGNRRGDDSEDRKEHASFDGGLRLGKTDIDSLTSTVSVDLSRLTRAMVTCTMATEEKVLEISERELELVA